MLRARVLVAAALVACGGAAQRPNAPRPGRAGPCYDLPGAPRYSLRLGPDGAAYWIERAIVYDFAGNSRSTDRLVRLDRATGATAILAAGVTAPIRLLRDGRVL